MKMHKVSFIILIKSLNIKLSTPFAFVSLKLQGRDFLKWKCICNTAYDIAIDKIGPFDTGRGKIQHKIQRFPPNFHVLIPTFQLSNPDFPIFKFQSWWTEHNGAFAKYFAKSVIWQKVGDSNRINFPHILQSFFYKTGKIGSLSHNGRKIIQIVFVFF